MSILRNDAAKVQEALVALERHDRKMDAILAQPPGQRLEELVEMSVERRRLSVVLEERAGILARLVLAVTP